MLIRVWIAQCLMVHVVVLFRPIFFRVYVTRAVGVDHPFTCTIQLVPFLPQFTAGIAFLSSRIAWLIVVRVGK